jgi:Flp pilus assembly protein TadG
MMRWHPRSRLFQRGVAAVEAAILLIPLVILLLGIAELGRVFYQYNTIAKSARDGARYLSQTGPGTATDAAAKCLVVTGSPAISAGSCTGSPLMNGLEVSNVSIARASLPAEGTDVPAMSLVTVTISGFRSVNFVPVRLPWIEFEPISATMRQAP